MPLLTGEPFLYPADLLEVGDPSPDASGLQWWALYTLARQEKVLMRRLRQQQIAHYCPLIPHQYRSPGGRRRVSHLPMFSNYVFMRGTEEQRYLARTSGCVSNCIVVEEPQPFVTELRSIQRLIVAGQPMHVEARLMPGTPVRIKSGPLEGVEGVITHRRGKDRLLVAVTLLQRGVSVELANWDLERL